MTRMYRLPRSEERGRKEFFHLPKPFMEEVADGGSMRGSSRGCGGGDGRRGQRKRGGGGTGGGKLFEADVGGVDEGLEQGALWDEKGKKGRVKK